MDGALIILDGWGLGNGGRDAVAAADTPAFDRLADAGAYGTPESGPSATAVTPMPTAARC